LLQLVDVVVVFLLKFQVSGFVVVGFLVGLALFLLGLSLVLFVGNAEFSVLLGVEIGFLLDFDHAFHHSHGKGAVLVAYSFNVQLEFFLNPMQFDPQLSYDVPEFSLFQLEVLLGFNVTL